MSDRKMTQRQFAVALGTDPSAVSRMLDGEQSWRPQQCEAAATALGVPLSDVLAHLGIDAAAGSAHMVPLIGWVNPRGEVTVVPPATGPRTVEAPTGLPDGAVALRTHTAGTGVAFRDGWLTYYVPRSDVPPDAIGRLCVVETVDGDVAIRVPSRGHIAGTYHLVAIREEVPIEENARLKSASPILWQKLV